MSEELIKELRDSQMELEAMLQNVPMLIMLVDGERRIRKANVAAARFARRSRQEMVGLRGGEALRCLHSTDSSQGCGFGPSCDRCMVRNTVLDTFRTGLDRSRVEATVSFGHMGKPEDLVFLVSTSLIPFHEETLCLVCVEDITARKRAEAELIAKERRWAITLASIGDAVIATDTGGKITFMNAVAEGLTGWSLREAEAKPITSVFNVINEYTKAKVENPAAMVLEKGTIAGLANHAVLVRKNGDEVPIDDSAAPISDHDGNLMGAVLVFRDITKRKEAEDIARHLASFPQLNPNPVIEVDPSGKIRFFNPCIQKILEDAGMDKENLSVFLPPDMDDIFKNWDGKTAFSLNREIIVKDRVFEEVVHLTPQFNVARIYASDITERKRAQEGMRMLAAVVQSADDAIIAKDLRGIITSWNTGAEKLFGYKAGEAIGRNISFLLPSGRMDEAPEIIEKIKRGEHIEHFETERMRKDGTVVPVSLTFSAVKDESGGIIGVSKVARDIAARKRAEREKEQLLSDLARSNRDLEQFAYIASHDLQEPLRTTAGFLGLLQKKYEGKLDAGADEYIRIAVDGAHRMQNLIRDLLSYSRIGWAGVEFKQINANEAFAEAVSNLAGPIQESGAVISKDDLPAVVGNETHLVQLFQNLIGNAIKFRRPDASPEIRIGVRSEAKDWVISVRDNGIGIKPKHYERIFQIFQRLHTREQYPGTGLGLALCKQIVERHKGRIWIESVPGEGTTFFFTLPKI